MNAGQIFVLAAGLIWLTAAGVILEISRVLGPSFHTSRTVHWGWRVLAWCGAAVAFAGGMTLLFPGQLVDVSRISIIAPLRGCVVLGLALGLLDWVMRDRAPPPWSVRVLQVAAYFGPKAVEFAAMKVPPANLLDTPPSHEPSDQRRSRLPILLGAIVMLMLIAAFLALNSPAFDSAG